jgi:hypothetical protein
MRYELNDFKWAAIRPMLPNKSRSVRCVNDSLAQWHLPGSTFGCADIASPWQSCSIAGPITAATHFLRGEIAS